MTKSALPTLAKLLGMNPVDGDIGIEIEMEGNKHFPPDYDHWWKNTEDNSLRGYCIEYITNRPIKIGEVKDYLQHLKKILEEKGIQIYDSFRAGVHVHVNCLDLNTTQLGNFAALYYCMETALTRFCGTKREGNFFCLRLKDAEYPLTLLTSSLANNNISPLNTDDLRYAALNLRSLFRHGTLEFRAMETTPNLEKIRPWVEILYRLKEYAVKMGDRKLISYDISYFGPKTWIGKILGPDLLELLDYPDLERDVIKDMRLVQELINLKDVG